MIKYPVSTSPTVSKSMKSNKSKGTNPELLLRKALFNNNLKGYRLNWDGASGRPDIAYPSRKIAIFIHGCFWHRCPSCKPALPKRNMDYWKNKFKKNKMRDQIIERELKKEGWIVMIFWECEIKSHVEKIIKQVKETYYICNK